MESFNQFKSQDYAGKLKTCITSESMPSDHEGSDLISFLYEKITNI